MIRQMKYFQSVVRNNSFSEAAEECHISQSAISQQIQALERELGFYLALEEFSTRYPDVPVKIEYGNHEELYGLLRTGGVDLILNDQRRAFSDQYVNLILAVGNEYIEISSRNPIAEMPSITPQELKNVPCILVSSREQQENEQEYYQEVIGFQGNFLYAESLEEARLLVIGGQGFMPVEGVRKAESPGTSISRIPLFRGNSQITRNYCAFWKKDHSGYYVEAFADILKRKFE